MYCAMDAYDHRVILVSVIFLTFLTANRLSGESDTILGGKLRPVVELGRVLIEVTTLGLRR